jgi:hypothetical protein
VPAAQPERDTSLVLWRCRVLEPGSHEVRIKSSNGMTQTRTITVTKAE